MRCSVCSDYCHHSSVTRLFRLCCYKLGAFIQDFKIHTAKNCPSKNKTSDFELETAKLVTCQHCAVPVLPLGEKIDDDDDEDDTQNVDVR